MPLFGPPNAAQLGAKRDVQGLIKLLAYRDAPIRRAAAEALAPLKDPRAVEPLVVAMHDADPTVRKACVEALAERGGLRVVDPLVTALNDPSPEVRNTVATAVYRRLMTDPEAQTRKATAMALGRMKNPSCVDPLLKAILDRDDDVRVAVIRSLEAQGDARAIEPLIVVQAHEQVRAKQTGRYSLQVERAADAALSTLCDASAIEALRIALEHEDPDVREGAVRRLGKIPSPEIVHPLVAALNDEDAGVRRLAARALQELGWEPSPDETGARYWAAVREWLRCVDSGVVAIPLLVQSFETADELDRTDILNALGMLNWEPGEATPLAARYWASRERWDKCIEMGPAAIEPLEYVLRHAPRWRDRVAAAEALGELGETRPFSFHRLDLVDRALSIIDGDDEAETRSGAFEQFLVGELQIDPSKGEAAAYCACGYPASRVRRDATRAPFSDLLGYEAAGPHLTSYYCPNCDARVATVSE